MQTIVLDFEATCDRKEPPRPQEIIEFPCVLLAAQTLEPVDQFSRFVRPIHHPILTPFCTELTSITQEQVDAAEPFPAVLSAHLAWLRSHNLQLAPDDGGEPFTFITCGDWDLRTMLPRQFACSNPPLGPVPWVFQRWINIKKLYTTWSGRRAPGMVRILRELDLEMTGHHHRGIDDCHNIAKIVRALVERGVPLSITSE